MIKVEKPNFEQKKELTPEQKKALGEAWAEMVVDGIEVPENIAEMNDEEIKKWLFDSLMKDTEKLVREWGLKGNPDLIEKIKHAKDVEEKSKLELEYVRDAHRQVDNLVKNFDRSGKKTTRYDSWPKLMRETGEFNCVGATLLGVYLLNEAEIKNYYGNPSGHVVNIVQLSNDSWFYVDFRNGKQQMMQIYPKETNVAGVRTLEIKEPRIDYRLISIYQDSELAGFILGNFSSLIHEANDPDIEDTNIAKIEARQYMEKYGKNFKNIDFSSIEERLYSEIIAFAESAEMTVEKKRILAKWDFEKIGQDYLRNLNREQQIRLFLEMKKNVEAISKLFYQDEKLMLSQVSDELRYFLELHWEKIKEMREHNQEDAEEEVGYLIGKIKNIK